MSKTTYYQRNRDVILYKGKDNHKNDKERWRDNTRDKYRNLSEEEKNKKREYGKNRYHNISKEKITKSYKLNTTIIYTKMTNNNDIKQLFKKFHNDDTKKGSLMMILKV